MSPFKPPSSLKEHALSVICDMVIQCTNMIQSKWKTFDTTECQVEAQKVGIQLFGQLPQPAYVELVNHLLSGSEYSIDNEHTHTVLVPPFELEGGELPNLFIETLPTMEQSEGLNEDLEDHRTLCAKIRIWLRIIFATKKVSTLNLRYWLWNQVAYKDALISELPNIGEHLTSFVTYYVNDNSSRWWYCESSLVNLDYSIIDAVCDHCPNLDEIAAEITHFHLLGSGISKLEKLTKLDLQLRLWEGYKPAIFAKINEILKNTPSLESVHLEIRGSDQEDSESHVQKWIKNDTVVSAKFGYSSVINKIDIDFVVQHFLNLTEIKLKWTCRENPGDEARPPTAEITDDIMKLAHFRFKRITISHFVSINKALLDFLQSQGKTLTALHLNRIANTSTKSVMSLSTACPYLEELQIGFAQYTDTEQVQETKAPRAIYLGRFRNLKRLGIASYKWHIERMLPELLDELDHTPPYIKMRDNKQIYDDGIEHLDTLLLSCFLGNEEIEIIRVGFQVEPTTVDLLAKQCPKLKQLHSYSDAIEVYNWYFQRNYDFTMNPYHDNENSEMMLIEV